MLRFCEACSKCYFYVVSGLIKNLLTKTVFSSHCLKLSLPMFLKYFLILLSFSLMFLIGMLLIRRQGVCYDIAKNLSFQPFCSFRQSFFISGNFRYPCAAIDRTHVGELTTNSSATV